jgi:hypothetical protein
VVVIEGSPFWWKLSMPHRTQSRLDNGRRIFVSATAHSRDATIRRPFARPWRWRRAAMALASRGHGAGVTDKLWSIGDIVAILEAWEEKQQEKAA